MIRLFIALPVLLATCQQDETISGYLDRDALWQLEEINDLPFDGVATLRFPGRGRIEGNAPCGRFGARQTSDYPWFGVERIEPAVESCAQQEAQGVFFEALRATAFAEVTEDMVILSGEGGHEMVFERVVR